MNIKKIAATLEISTIPIRDAMKRLEMENVVVINPRSSCYVKKPTRKEILDAFDSRLLLEMYSIRQFHSTVNSNQLTTLENIVARMETLQDAQYQEEVLDEYVKLDRMYHTELCRLSGNSFVEKFYREVEMHLSMSHTYGIGVSPDIRQTCREHRQMLESIRQNSSQAVELLEHHLNNSRANIVHGSVFQSLD